jgi:ATP-binding cassette, subfamily B, bacterial MsbA
MARLARRGRDRGGAQLDTARRSRAVDGLAAAILGTPDRRSREGPHALSTASDSAAGRVPVPARSALWRLFGYARRYLWPIVAALVLSSVFSAGRFGRAYLVKPIFDDVIAPSQALHEAGGKLPFELGKLMPREGGSEPSGSAAPAPPLEESQTRARLEAQISGRLAEIIGAILVIVLGMPIVLFAREYLVAWVLGRIDLDMKIELCGRLLALPLRFHRNRNRGDLLARLMGDVGMAQGALALVFDDFAEAFVMLVVGAASLLLVSWQLSLVMLVVGPAIFATISIFGRKIRKSAHRRQREFADVTGRLIEILEGIKVIKAFRAEDHEQDGFARSSHRLFRRGMRVAVNRTLARTFVDALNNLAAVSVVVLGIFLVLRGRWGLTLGDLGAFAAITVTLYRPVRTLARGWVRVVDAEPSAERYFEVLDSPLEVRDASDAVAIGRIHGGIRFDAVTFSYGREPVLEDVRFEARAGEVVAIVGRTGAGKTTLIDLLLRFYDPTGGKIEIDGVDLRRVQRASLLDQMAVVSQEPFLFDGTIRENIRYGRLDASDEDILAAARAAHVDEFAEGLPQGYDTEVGAAGTRLSGGQRQRVTIARAILRDPAILILDEATSSLDSKSERLVQDAIEKLMPGRTAFVIAHRLSTVRAANTIVVLEHGRVSQIGSHDELMAQSGLYRELIELQQAAARPDEEAEL